MNKDVQKLFDKAVDDMFSEGKNYIAMQVTRLGYPSTSCDGIPTAGVAWDKKRKKVNFYFNQEFLNGISYELFKFVLAHEASHLFHGHIFQMANKQTESGLSRAETNIWLRKFNIAADCVINDSLVNLYGFDKLDKDGSEGSTVLYGQDVVGFDCENFTALEVMNLIPENNSSFAEMDSHELWESFFDGSGNFDQEFVDTMKEIVSSCTENSSLSPEELEGVEKLKDAMRNSADAKIRKAGNGVVSSKSAIDGLGKESLKWKKLLYEKTESRQIEDRWSKSNRKLSAFYPDIILPHSEYKEKDEIFLAIDVSGSIDREAVRLFLTLAKNTPKNFKVKAITFNTNCKELDLKNGSEIPSGGGTAFDIIEDYILDRFKQYPKAIFVLTDGCGNSVSPRHPNRWTWLLYGNSMNDYCKDMTHYKIKDLMV